MINGVGEITGGVTGRGWSGDPDFPNLVDDLGRIRVVAPADFDLALILSEQKDDDGRTVALFGSPEYAIDVVEPAEADRVGWPPVGIGECVRETALFAEGTASLSTGSGHARRVPVPSIGAASLTVHYTSVSQEQRSCAGAR